MYSSVKAAPMTKDETMLLLQLVATNTIINNKATNAANNKLKEEAWETISSAFNTGVSSFPRTLAQLRLKWENLKKSARKRNANKKSSETKTGSLDNPLDEVLNKVDSLLNSTCEDEGFTVEFGGDTTTTKVSAVGGKQKRKLEEETCKAVICKEKALTEYLIAKKKKIDMEIEEKELGLAKLRLELENAKLENLKLKVQLNIKD